MGYEFLERRADPVAEERESSRKLRVGAADDPAERDADRIAARVPVMRASTQILSGGAGRGRIRRNAAIGAEGGALDADTARAVNAARGGGAPIAPDVEEHLSDSLGADVSGVRLHAGTTAADLNDRMQASAFTIGNDVFFRDGVPDPSSRDGMNLLAHEVAHTVQQGSSPLRRQIVRRRLIAKALDAFNAAEAANSAYATGRKDTDDLAAEADQSDLTRVHGRMHDSSKDSADERKVAYYVRAVVLSRYAAKLRELENGPLQGKQKAAKKKLYKTKADEFRKQHLPLVAKGSKAPETRGFMQEHGFGAAFVGEEKAVKTAPQTAHIDVRSTFIGMAPLGIRMRSHLFIVYTAKDGRQLYFRGGPDHNNPPFTVSDMGDYVPEVTTDWDPSAPSVTVLEGAAAEAKLDALIEATRVIDRMKVPYQGVLGMNEGYKAMAAGVLSGEGENCNATAWTILTRAGIPARKPSGYHAGWGSILGSKTAGKENALPAPEVAGPGTPYTVDDSRDVTDKNGMIQIYRDRDFFEPLIKVGSGTKVTLLRETEDWRRITFGGEVGYVKRWSEDVDYDLLPGWIEALKANYTDVELATIQANPTNVVLNQAEQDTGVPADKVVAAIGMALHADGVTAALIWYRLQLLGKSRVRELISNPKEMARLAVNLRAKMSDVMAVATQIVGDVELELQVPVVLQKHLNDPNAANIALNEMPDYPTLNAVATELHVDVSWVADQVDALRPNANRGVLFEELLDADPIAQSELPNVAEFMLKTWAPQCGVTVDFLKQRCQAVHTAREAKKAEQARLKAEADAKAKERQVPVALQKHLNDPNAANLAVNEAPDYPTLAAVATELHADFDWVFTQVDALRPDANRGHVFQNLLEDDEIAESELPDVALYMLKDWAAKCGVTVAFLQQRCRLVHAANEAAKVEQAKINT